MSRGGFPLLLCTLLATSCGKEPTHETIAALLPQDANLVVRFSSLDDLKVLDRAIAKFSPLSGGAYDSLAAVAPESMATDRPLVVAVKLQSLQALPPMTALVPATDPEALARELERDGTTVVRGDYVALSTDPRYEATGNPLYAGLKDATISARGDVASLRRAFGDDLDAQIESAASMISIMARVFAPEWAPADLADGIKSWSRRVLDEGESCGAWVDTKGDDVRIELDYTARAGTRAAAIAAEVVTLRDLARHVPRGAAAVLLARVDGRTLGKLLRLSTPVFEGCGPDWLISIAPSAGGLRGVLVVDTKNPLALFDGLVNEVREKSGARLMEDSGRTEREYRVRRVRLEWDDASDRPLWGKRIVLDCAVRKGRVVLTADADGALLGEVLRNPGPPADLERALAAVGGSVHFFVLIEARALVRAAAVALSRSDLLPEGGPVPVFAYGATEGRTFRYGLSVPVHGLALLKRGLR